MRKLLTLLLFVLLLAGCSRKEMAEARAKKTAEETGAKLLWHAWMPETGDVSVFRIETEDGPMYLVTGNAALGTKIREVNK